MTNIPTQPRERAIQAALIGASAGALAIGALCERGRLSKPYELASSIGVLGAAIVAWRRARARGAAAVTELLIRGVACGLAGDVVMGKVLPLPERVYVPLGMLTFGAGHIAYVQAFYELAQRRGLTRRGAFRAALAVNVAIGALAWQHYVRNDERLVLSYAALVYGLLLSVMSGSAIALALQDRRYAPLALGGELFVASDLILGARLLRGLNFPSRDEIIWLTYIAAQALIVWTASDPGHV